MQGQSRRAFMQGQSRAGLKPFRRLFDYDMPHGPACSIWGKVFEKASAVKAGFDAASLTAFMWAATTAGVDHFKTVSTPRRLDQKPQNTCVSRHTMESSTCMHTEIEGPCQPGAYMLNCSAWRHPPCRCRGWRLSMPPTRCSSQPCVHVHACISALACRHDMHAHLPSPACVCVHNASAAHSRVCMCMHAHLPSPVCTMCCSGHALMHSRLALSCHACIHILSRAH